LKNAWTAFFNGLLDQAQTNGLVDSADQIIVRNNTTTLANQLNFLVVGAGGPFAPESSAGGGSGGGGGDDSGVASALATSSSGSSSASGPGLPGWLDLRLESLASAASGVSAPMLDAASRQLDRGHEITDEDGLEDELLDLLVSVTN
jgi:hypothetical protein